MSNLYKMKNGTGHVVVVERIVRFAAQGGGFIRALKEDEFNAQYERADAAKEFVYKPAIVTAEWLPNHVSIDCFWDGRYWNGAGVPVFTREAGEEMMKHTPGLQFDKDENMFVSHHPEGGGEIYRAITIKVDGVEHEVFAIGAFAWMWNEPIYVD